MNPEILHRVARAYMADYAKTNGVHPWLNEYPVARPTEHKLAFWLYRAYCNEYPQGDFPAEVMQSVIRSSKVLFAKYRHLIPTHARIR